MLESKQVELSRHLAEISQRNELVLSEAFNLCGRLINQECVDMAVVIFYRQLMISKRSMRLRSFLFLHIHGLEESPFFFWLVLFLDSKASEFMNGTF